MRFRLLTAAAAVSVWVLVAVGGVVRVTESGLGCPHWPLCTAGAVPLDRRASIIDYSHRAVVAWVTLLVAAVAILAWRTQRQRRDILWPSLLAAALVPLSGAARCDCRLARAPRLGRRLPFRGRAALPGGDSGHRRSGLAKSEAVGDRRLHPTCPPWRLVGLALVSVGAAVVATDADSACGTQWPACNGGFASGGGHAELQVAHRMLAYTVAAIAVTLFVLALRGHGPRPAGALPTVLVLAQISLGIGIVLAGGDGRAHEILAGAHEAGAGLVWGLLVALATLSRPGKRLPLSQYPQRFPTAAPAAQQ